MDTYCIQLGYLLDNPSIPTLENPGEHSLHWYVMNVQFELLLIFVESQRAATTKS
jgi:hypothetical protein